MDPFKPLTFRVTALICIVFGSFVVGVNLQLHCYFLKELEEVIENLKNLKDW